MLSGLAIYDLNFSGNTTFSVHKDMYGNDNFINNYSWRLYYMMLVCRNLFVSKFVTII